MTYVAQRALPTRPIGRIAQALPAAVDLLPALLLAGVGMALAQRWWQLTAEVATPLNGGILTLPLAELLRQLPGLAVVGLLLLRLLTRSRHRTVVTQHLSGMAARWSWAWVAATVVSLVLTASELTGTSVAALWTREDLVNVMARSDQAMAQIATLWGALVIASFGARLAQPRQVAALLLLGAAALLPYVPDLPPGVAGHSADGHAVSLDLHWLSVLSLGVQLLATAVWLGALVGVVVHLRVYPLSLRQVLPRFGNVAALCVLVVGLAALVQHALALSSWAALGSSGAGHLVVAKALALLLLSTVGFRHRRRMLTSAGQDKVPFVQLVVGELVLMGAVLGIVAVLTTAG